MPRSDTHENVDRNFTVRSEGQGIHFVCIKEETTHGSSERNDPHPSEGLRSPAHRPERGEDRGDRQAHRRYRLRPHPICPTKKEVVTIPCAAVHKYKDSREQFERRTHKRLIDVVKPSPKTVEALMSLELPAGVEIEIKL